MKKTLSGKIISGKITHGNKKSAEELSSAALRVTPATHKATKELARKRGLTHDELLREMLRQQKAGVR
jgi:hypothetical protein